MTTPNDTTVPPEELEGRHQAVAALYGNQPPEEVFRVPHVMFSPTPLSSRRAFGILAFTSKAVFFLLNSPFRLPRTLGLGMIVDAVSNVADQELDAEFASMMAASATANVPLTTLIDSAADVFVFPRDQIVRAAWPWWLSRALRLNLADGSKRDFYLNRMKRALSVAARQKIDAYFQ